MAETPTLPNMLANLLSVAGSDNGILRASLESIMAGSTPNNRVFVPYADVVNTEREFKVYIDLPGMRSENIKVDFFNNQLCVSGERQIPSPEESGRRECLYGSFTKKIPLPHSVTNQKSVRVTYINGVLTIIVNKSMEEANRFTIRVSEEKDGVAVD